MTRLKIHHLSEAELKQADIAEKCGVGLRSVERILKEPRPTTEDVTADRRAAAAPIGRPLKATPEMIEAVRLILAMPGCERITAIEVLRRMKADHGYTGGRNQMTELVKKLRPKPTREPVVRFEGMPGEYAQFDFGECEVQTAAGALRVQFFAGRLKYSRFMHVLVVPNQRAETLVRSVIACLAAFGGSPKEWVFDNPKTVRTSTIGVKPIVLHRYLRQLVAEYDVTCTLCAPASGNQKGSVERLVGYVKNSFFRVGRTFRDIDDIEAQLAAWLVEVNGERPSDATGIIPNVAKEDEKVWLNRRPLQTTADAWAITASATVGPMGTVPYAGTTYSATAVHLGTTATLSVRAHELEVHVAGESSVHLREDHTGEVRRLPEHREAVIAVLHGTRKIATFRRQCLLELGPPAFAFLCGLVHSCPQGRWEGPCTELYALLMKHGDDPMRAAFAACARSRTFTVGAVSGRLGVAA